MGFSRTKVATFCILLIAVFLPIEHKYDKWFRFYSLSLIPDGLSISKSYDKKLYFYLSDFVSLFLFFFTRYSLKVSWRRLFFHPLWIFFALAVLSLIASPFQFYPVAYNRLFQLATPLMLFSVITQVYSSFSRKKFTRLIVLGIAFMGTLQAFLGTAQYFRSAPLGLRLFGETKQTPVIFVEGGKKWMLDFSKRTDIKMPVLRAYGTFPSTNVFGGFLVFSILGCYYILAQSKKKKWWFALILSFQIFALFLCFSRAALLAFFLSSILWSYFVYKEKLSIHWKWIAICATLSCIFSGILLHQQLYRRGGIIHTTDLSRGADRGRVQLIKVGLDVLFHHPLFGLGLSQFSERAQPYFKKEASQSVKSSAPHNIFLFLACELGLPALFIFCWVLFSLVRAYSSTRISLESATFFSLFIGYILIGLCDFYPILFQQGKLIFFLILANLSLHSKSAHESDLIKKY